MAVAAFGGPAVGSCCCAIVPFPCLPSRWCFVRTWCEPLTRLSDWQRSCRRHQTATATEFTRMASNKAAPLLDNNNNRRRAVTTGPGDAYTSREKVWVSLLAKNEGANNKSRQALGYRQKSRSAATATRRTRRRSSDAGGGSGGGYRSSSKGGTTSPKMRTASSLRVGASARLYGGGGHGGGSGRQVRRSVGGGQKTSRVF